jgi:hypothetical protein
MAKRIDESKNEKIRHTYRWAASPDYSSAVLALAPVFSRMTRTVASAKTASE